MFYIIFGVQLIGPMPLINLCYNYHMFTVTIR